ncbi:MAG: Flp pilus assembly complex ATPase component TadA [Clostridia bacterium]|nr:Flp pilus assembly complex ATPase component TadA [Clostridia bacterium]
MSRDYLTALELIPGRISREIESVVGSRAEGGACPEELRLRVGGVCSVIVGGRSVRLYEAIERNEADELVYRLCHGSIYAYRDTITNGYIPMSEGGRVGICGSARYEDGRMIGVSEVSSLVFRFPSGGCDFAEELYSIWCGCNGGILIVSPPRGGKTTALRALVGLVGGRAGKQVVAVDERCELSGEDYARASVDVLRGYDRKRGVELALRTMSPEVIAVDEIGNDGDAEALLAALGAGVGVIATAHGGSVSGACRREPVRRLAKAGMFDSALRIQRDGTRFSVHAEDIEAAIS